MKAMSVESTLGYVYWMDALSDEKKRLAEDNIGYVYWMLNSGRLSGFVAKHGRDEIESLCMMVLCEAASRFDPTKYKSFPAYFRWLAPRRLINYFERRAIDAHNVDFSLDETVCEKNRQPAFESDDVVKLNKAMMRLTAKQREIVYLTIGMGFRAETVSKEYGVTSQAIECTRKCAITNLRIMFGVAKRKPDGRTKSAKRDKAAQRA